MTIVADSARISASVSSIPKISWILGKSESSESVGKRRDDSSGISVTGMPSRGNRGLDESALAQCKSVLESD